MSQESFEGKDLKEYFKTLRVWLAPETASYLENIVQDKQKEIKELELKLDKADSIWESLEKQNKTLLEGIDEIATDGCLDFQLNEEHERLRLMAERLLEKVKGEG